MSLTLSSFKAVIFDMDGVLIDSEPVWKIAMQAVFDEVGCGLTKKDFQKTVGLRLDEVILFWYNHTGWEGLTPQEVEEKIVQRMVELISKDGKPLIGVIETLQFLKAKGLKIGLATSSYSVLIETVLTKLNIKSYFDFTHSAEHESHGKPHPAVYLAVAEKLNVIPNECLVIEDSLNGIISGKAARMRVICIPEKTHSPEPRLILADYQFETMLDFLNEVN
jgi:mannitol-1-/sugar-/sorbitol-6-/2-deoxyglucose-6-phosphatase